MKHLFFFRLSPAGQRERWKFTLDDDMLIVKEEREEEETPPVVFETRPDGGKMITQVSPAERQVLSFFVDTTPCWFPGCAELRARYKAELSELGTACPACEKGALIRKYSALVRERTKTATVSSGKT